MEDRYPTTDAMSPEQRPMHSLLAMLKGGDRRSIGKANEAVAMVLKEPELFNRMVRGVLIWEREK